jgi:hypothetical protein
VFISSYFQSITSPSCFHSSCSNTCMYSNLTYLYFVNHLLCFEPVCSSHLILRVSLSCFHTKCIHLALFYFMIRNIEIVLVQLLNWFTWSLFALFAWLRVSHQSRVCIHRLFTSPYFLHYDPKHWVCFGSTGTLIHLITSSSFASLIVCFLSNVLVFWN